jgi:hypothetical protein
MKKPGCQKCDDSGWLNIICGPDEKPCKCNPHALSVQAIDKIWAPMDVYLACSSKRRLTAKEYMKRLRGSGYHIAYDWTEEVTKEAQLPPHELAERSKNVVRSVINADVLVLIATDAEHHEGELVELGAAFAIGNEVIVVEHDIRFSGFFGNHPLVTRVAHSDTMLDVLSALRAEYIAARFEQYWDESRDAP